MYSAKRKSLIEKAQELLGKYPQVLKYLKKGLSIRQISGLTNKTSTNTILKVKKTAIKKGILTHQ